MDWAVRNASEILEHIILLYAENIFKTLICYSEYLKGISTKGAFINYHD